eukprot:TRINITY_DN2645_c0_g1_i2.p1 TRINITY_DN2645_c0_g1~~TRINITY_DN2645_c0_g1_i2.p1  ORF type:complete len:295 (+),score=73.13 TRINITY_DN2645_c0_g1_i2:362-1246(+)
MIRIDCVLPATPEQACRFNDVCTDEERAVFDGQIKIVKILEEVKKDINVIYMVYKGIFPVSEREVVAYKATIKLPDGTWVSFGETIIHEAESMKSSPVRAKGKFALFCEPIPGKPFSTMCRKIILMDPMGSLPKWVVTKTQSYSARAQLLLADVLKARYGNQVGATPTEPVAEEGESGEDVFFDIVEYKEEEFLQVDSSQKLSAIRTGSRPKPTETTTVTTAPVVSLSEILKSTQASADKLAKRLDQLEKASKSRSGITLSWVQLSFLVTWPLVVLGFYHWWRKRGQAVKALVN